VNFDCPFKISQETYLKLETYRFFLSKWNQSTSLVQEATLPDFYSRHVFDSLQLVPFIFMYFIDRCPSDFVASFKSIHFPNKDSVESSPFIYPESLIKPYPFIDFPLFLESLPEPLYDLSILDIGSGAGFPGMILALCGFKNVVLCDSNHKKCLFLEELARELHINVTILNDRVENVSHKYDVVTSRAFSDLRNLVKIFNFVSRETKSIGLFLKGKKVFHEIEISKKVIRNKYRIYKSFTSDDGSIFCISS